MASLDYEKAYKMGKRDYQMKVLRGEHPTLQTLDDILPPKGSYSEVPLGLVNIPISQIVGTKNAGRSSAFASNFMPILADRTEFSAKWDNLCRIHMNEGIRDPIKAYEYMNQFYVEEGNKRVSVMKYFDVVSIPGIVTRIVPQRTQEKENIIYYEFLEFYRVSEINYIWFSKIGSFPELQKAVGKEPDEVWTGEDKLEFSSVFSRFSSEYRAKGGEKLDITTGDAFLSFIKLYDYKELSDMTTRELRDLIAKSWEEFVLQESDDEISLKMNPNKEKKPLFSMLLPGSHPKFDIAFLYEKNPMSSAWTYSHELGRMHLEQTFPDEVHTTAYANVTVETAKETIDQAIRDGNNMIFTTTPAFVQASVQAAIENPDVRILNCSLNTSHRYIRTYYARMHEAKFLMGAIAGAMASNDKLAYIEDYPIYGSIASINAFALGAQMVNPRVKVYLEWSSRKGFDLKEFIHRVQPSFISGKDMVIPEEASRFFGVYSLNDDHPCNLAMPIWHWGKFYEQLIRTIMNGTWKYDDDPDSKKAINYWWGISAGVVDVIGSQKIPQGTERLIRLLKKSISAGTFSPFGGVLYSQNGIVQDDPDRCLEPEEIVTMNWLADNIIGCIPTDDKLKEYTKALMSQQGVEQWKKGR